MSEKLAINVNGKIWYLDLFDYDIFEKDKGKKILWFNKELGCYVCIIKGKLHKIYSLPPRELILKYLEILESDNLE